MTYLPIAYEVQNLDCHGIPTTEYRHQPEHPADLEESYSPNIKLIHQGEQDKLNRMPPCFAHNLEYLRGYKSPGAHYITEIQGDTAERGHYLITLIHHKTKEEKLVDLLTDGYGFTTVRRILSCHCDSHYWGIFEVLDMDEPF